MQIIPTVSRHQMGFSSLDCLISANNEVRLIDAFVQKLDLDKLGFISKDTSKTGKDKRKAEGRPSYHPKVFLKLYVYGYLNGLRSSRRLERECGRNIELQWLLEGLVPNYHSIADFRKDNPCALRNTFKLFVCFLKDMGLVGGNTIAIDGTKVRAHNSKKNNFTPKKLERHLEYIENKITEYVQQLDANDAIETPEVIKEVKEKIERLKTNKIKYEALQKQLDQSEEPQVSTTDAEARSLLVQGQVVEVVYNVQAAVDAQYKLVVATHTINRNDRNALSDIAIESKENLQSQGFTALADKGYHNGRQLHECQAQNIETIVAPPTLVNSNTHGTTPGYMVDKFSYDATSDTYTCPQGETLKTKGTWHSKSRDGKESYKFKKYRTPACASCPVKHLCTGRKDGGRELDRSEFAATTEANTQRYKQNPEHYRSRQEINEHIFGTIKRKWGYNHTNLKGLKKVNGEFALIMMVYNIKRCQNILGINKFIEKMLEWQPDYSKVVFKYLKRSSLKPFYALKKSSLKIAA
jgi:transposase